MEKRKSIRTQKGKTEADKRNVLLLRVPIGFRFSAFRFSVKVWIRLTLAVEILYWVVRKIRADFKGKLKRKRFNIHLLNLNLLRHELSGQPNSLNSFNYEHQTLLTKCSCRPYWLALITIYIIFFFCWFK